ncbi:PREDICTED: putative late blight resistance protein homolog R1A-4 [Ipomoea nil]|uniref:putative late blight resistance protein homolog R1A-4 n=1 Tax=Ipomoea nil TaxID=35883 RepID=UPI00090096F5|nr:PREDICTED: putative late blight resistance protein homolog R1A-4 [Ipomoea nil]
MAYAAVTSLMETLSLHFLQSQPRLPLQYKQQIVSLHENLGFLKEVLEKSEIAYGYDNSAMKDLEAQMRDVAFKAEERIEMELTTIHLAKGWTKRLRIKACLLKLHGIFIQAVIQTDYLKKKLIKIKSEKQLAKGPLQDERMRQRGLLHGSTSSQPDLERENNIIVSKFSKKASTKFDNSMVGCNEEFKTIIDQLTQQSAKQLQVVSIVGMGGIGKTTLAHKVYEDPSISFHFDKQAWVTVSQESNEEQMLQCLIGCVNAPSNGNLAESLRKHLKDQRYLIVIDDIWSTTAWDSLQRCFPDDNNGSRILLTSRLREVAEYVSSVFSEDYEIHVKKLVKLWAAEGFLRVVDHRNMEEVAMECLQDLVDRSLVFVSKESYNGKMKTIRIHDLLRDLCLREARHENLLNVIGDEKLPFYKKKISYRWISTTSGFHLLTYIYKSHSLHSPYVAFSASVEGLFSHFKLLRVVDIACISSYVYGLQNVLANLIHLRYLALEYSASYYPINFHLELFEHWNMQSFIVRGAHAAFDCFGASGVWKMPLLRNLCIELIVSLETLSVVHRNLESISWLPPNICTEDLFTRIPNLKKLGIHGEHNGKNLDCFYNFVHLRQLEELSIREWRNLNRIPCSGISWATSFLPNLKKLKFYQTNFAWSDMRLIGMLPNLEVLKLKQAFHISARIWEPSKEGFRQLKRLVIKDMYFERWNAVGDNFPVLECLELHNCNYLQEIPSDFADITTLALIQLNWCWYSVLASAKLIQEEQYNNYGNVVVVRSENIVGRRDEEEESDE